MPHPLKRLTRRLLLPLTAAAAVLTLTAATTTTPVYQGYGWKAWTANSIYSLSPEPYTIVFADTTARAQLTPYLTGPATQVTSSVGVPITVTTTLDTTPTNACPAKHRIVVHYSYRPTGVAGMSEARACHALADGSAWGGHILMDSEYWTSSNWFSTDSTVNDARRRDAVAHELGHILGLAHPNTDLDRDGVVEHGECVRNSAGLRPLMCAPNRGNPPTTAGGRFTSEFDVPGLRQMLDNYWLRQT
jgi:hypothetical protein